MERVDYLVPAAAQVRFWKRLASIACYLQSMSCQVMCSGVFVPVLLFGVPSACRALASDGKVSHDEGEVDRNWLYSFIK